MSKKNHKKSLRVAIVRFPASNCDWDTYNYFKNAGHKPYFIWYQEKKLGNPDLLILPGGFAFGDRVYRKATHEFKIDPGEQAIKSPVMQVIFEAAKKKIPILGICNGFQILVKAGLLPGKLEQNDVKKFVCDWTTCEVEGRSFFEDKSLLKKKLKVPVAHGYGRYSIDKKTLKKLQKNGQIFLKYVGFNPNGSFQNIAGVSNSDGTIFGMMPHPERSIHKAYFMKAIGKYVPN